MNSYAYYAGWQMNGTDPTGLFLLIDFTVSDAARTGMRMYGAYDKTNAFVKLAKNLMAGMSAQQALAGLAAEYAMEKAGGKIFDKALGGLYKIAKVGMDKVGGGIRHHILAKFLGGATPFANDLLKKLPRSVHERYHEILREVFQSRTLPAPSSMSRDKWMKYLEDTNAMTQVQQALLDATAQFDREFAKKGHALLPDLLEQMYKQGWGQRQQSLITSLRAVTTSTPCDRRNGTWVQGGSSCVHGAKMCCRVGSHVRLTSC